MTTQKIPENQDYVGVSSFGERLQRYRKVLNVSAEELAEKIKKKNESSILSRSIIANIENDRRKVTKFDEIAQLARGLGMSPLALICDLEQPLLPSDNPIFQGMTNYEVSRAFLARNFESPLKKPLDNLIGIYSVFNRYLTGRSYLLEKMHDFDDFVSGRIDEGRTSHFEEYDGTGAVVYDRNCKQQLLAVQDLYSQLEKVNVIIPREERERFHRVELKIDAIRKIAKDKKLLTQEFQERYDQWEKDMIADNEEILDRQDPPVFF